jgi:hypothetical protein
MSYSDAMDMDNLYTDQPLEMHQVQGGAKGKMSKAEIDEWLKGCIEIPTSKWTTLPDNSQICYFKKDGGFVKSGFVKLSFEKEGERYIRYGSKLGSWSGDKYYKEFTLKLSNVKKLYKRVSQDAIFEYKLISAKISTRMKELETKQDDLDRSVKKVVMLIKKLHNIKSLDDIRNSASS